eukprot:scaffold12862_cov116-Isochrysis_galbana.AAC.12
MATVPAAEATRAAEADEAAAALQALLEEEEDDLAGFQADEAVQEALSTGRDLRQYAEEVESALRAVERESINDYIRESESLAGLHTQIRECDGVLDTMESMLRGFQGDLASISSQIKYLQDESLSMNVKLRNRKAAETQLSSFITQIVVPPELISNICDAPVDEAYLGHVRELDKKVQFAKLEQTAMTSACADISPELEKLRIKSVQKIRDFLLDRIGRLKRKMTNTQILQASVLLKYRGLYHFLQEHAPEVTVEVRESYTATMSGVYLTKLRCAARSRSRRSRCTHGHSAAHTLALARPPSPGSPQARDTPGAAAPRRASPFPATDNNRSLPRATCSALRSGWATARRISRPSQRTRAATPPTGSASGARSWSSNPISHRVSFARDKRTLSCWPCHPSPPAVLEWLTAPPALYRLSAGGRAVPGAARRATGGRPAALRDHLSLRLHAPAGRGRLREQLHAAFLRRHRRL